MAIAGSNERTGKLGLSIDGVGVFVTVGLFSPKYMTEKPETRRIFATTHWSVVLAAGEGGSVAAESALETLCRAYWYPIYVYVRRKGHKPEPAQDLTQEFFAQLISKDHLKLADRNKGKFRTFLLAMLDHFLAREWSRAHRQKRGGQFSFISFDKKLPEERYRLEPQDNETPAKHFDRQWAMTVLEKTMTALEGECTLGGKVALFREVRPFLTSGREAGAYTELSKRLDLSEGAVRVAIHRLRQRYGELLRAEIAQTVERPADIEEEIRYLLGVLNT
jgi:DNA-directed RNA polymerase specialized sigma24 family protein